MKDVKSRMQLCSKHEYYDDSSELQVHTETISRTPDYL